MNQQNPHCVDVAVLGAGPAGVAAAVELLRMGWSVRLFCGDARTGIEGASDRMLEQLRRRQLSATLASIRVYGPRKRDWAGTQSDNGGEYLIERPRFDAALRTDALAAGVPCEARAQEVWRDEHTWLVQSDRGLVRARAVVEARGRRVRGTAQKGPRLLALRRRYRGAGAPGTAIMMARDAWYWMACDGLGSLLVQAVGSPRGSGGEQALKQRLLGMQAMPQALVERLSCASPEGVVSACAAGASCRRPADEEGRVLAGDATVALDPLAGHGLYEALAGTPAVVAAVNTWLTGGRWAPVKEFMTARTQESWARKMAFAHTFYADAAAAQPDAFWLDASRGYGDAAAKAVSVADSTLRVEVRPVLNGNRIEQRRVLVGAQWPRGIWYHGDIELADLFESGRRSSWDTVRTAENLGRSSEAVQNAIQWLKVKGVLPQGGARQREHAGVGDGMRER